MWCVTKKFQSFKALATLRSTASREVSYAAAISSRPPASLCSCRVIIRAASLSWALPRQAVSNDVIPSGQESKFTANIVGSHGRCTAQCRFFSSGRNYRESKKKNPSAAAKNHRPRISARPPGEKEIETKFPLPDRDKEQELGRLQNNVQDLHRSGQYAQALKAAQTLLEATIDHFGREHPATATAYNNTGLMRKLQGDFDAARSDYVAAQQIYKSTVGTDHASYASALHNLGNLNRSQIHFDSALSATDRLSLVESALQYLQEAHAIRLAELGSEHPHTVSSRSSWGATLAARILHHHKMTEAIRTTGDLVKKRFYVSILPTDVTLTAWDAAEEHLREALQTAIKSPRGVTIEKASKVPQRGGKKKVSKKLSEQPTTPQTLSAAAAAQNLAVFLKARATTVQPYEQKWLKEAEMLYRQVLTVQAALLPQHEQHPDMYATKHSLAELLEAMGDEVAANVIRQEIVDTYDPPAESKDIATSR